MRTGVGRVAYALKRFPRLSQTFILDEVLAHEAAGFPLELISFRPPFPEIRHASLARLRSPVEILDPRGTAKDDDLVDALADALGRSEIAHVHTHFASKSAGLVRRATRIAGLSYSFTAHGRDLFHNDVVEHELRAKVADAAAVVAISRYHLEDLRARFPDLATRFVLVRNGLDLSDHTFDPGARAPILLGIGRLVPKKGFDLLLRACRLLADRGVRAQCEILGDGPERSRLERLIQELDLGGRVRLRGPVDQDHVRTALRAASALVAPCRVAPDGDRDGLPTVLLEAMAAGTPCISTDVSAIPEVVRDGITGFLVPRGSPAGIAEACQRVLQNRTDFHPMVCRAREEVQKHFDSRRNARALRRVFRRVRRVTGRVA